MSERFGIPPFSSAPVFDRKVGHASELVHIVRDHRQIVGECDRGDHEVIAADQFAPQFEMMADSGVVGHACRIERQAGKRCQKANQDLSAFGRVSVLLGTVKKLCLNHRANPHAARRFRRHLFGEIPRPVFQYLNDQIGIEQPTNGSPSVGVGGGSSGASNSSPARLPAYFSKCPSGHPRASVAGFLRSARESSIKSLTTRSSLLAESSSSSRSLFSNSAATALMRYRISPQRRISRRWSHPAPIPVRQCHRLSPS